MKRFQKNILIIISLIGLFSVQPVFAFTLILDSQGEATSGWGSSTVTFDMDVSCNSYSTAVQSAVNAAISTWGSVSTSALSVSLGTTVTLPHAITTYVGSSATSSAPQGNPIIYCDTSFGTNAGVDANSIPGYAGAQNIDTSGQIKGALLVLNVQSGATANVTTLDSSLANVILAHEIGHCLGFGHSADKNALMYYATGAGRQAVLAKDDIDAVSYLYPRQELSSNGLMGCGTIRKGDNSPQGRRNPSSLPLDWGWVEFPALFLICWAFCQYLKSRGQCESLSVGWILASQS